MITEWLNKQKLIESLINILNNHPEFIDITKQSIVAQIQWISKQHSITSDEIKIALVKDVVKELKRKFLHKKNLSVLQGCGDMLSLDVIMSVLNEFENEVKETIKND